MSKNQAKLMSEMVDMIRVRDHLYNIVNGPRTSLVSKTEEKELREFASQLDRQVVDCSLAIKRGALAPKKAPTKKVTPAKKVTTPVSNMAAANAQAQMLKEMEAQAQAEGALDVSLGVESGEATTASVQAAPEPEAAPEPQAQSPKGVVRRVQPE